MTLPVRHQCSPSGLMTAAADFSTNVENGRKNGREKWSQKWSRKSYCHTCTQLLRVVKIEQKMSDFLPIFV